LTEGRYPRSENWTDFRKSIADAEHKRDGQCREMNLARQDALLMQEVVILGDYL
jgi:hypothetical protein